MSALQLLESEPWETGVKPYLLRIEIEAITGVSFPVREAT
jgi:hypothetical protein